MVLLLWLTCLWIFTIWKGPQVIWKHCATWYLFCTLCTFLLCASCQPCKLFFQWCEIFFALCIIGPQAPTYIFQLLLSSSHTQENLLTYFRWTWWLFSSLRLKPLSLPLKPLPPAHIISMCTYVISCNTFTGHADVFVPVSLVAPYSLLTSFTPFEQCKGETTFDCLTDFAPPLWANWSCLSAVSFSWWVTDCISWLVIFERPSQHDYRYAFILLHPRTAWLFIHIEANNLPFHRVSSVKTLSVLPHLDLNKKKKTKITPTAV